MLVRGRQHGRHWEAYDYSATKHTTDVVLASSMSDHANMANVGLSTNFEPLISFAKAEGTVAKLVRDILAVHLIEWFADSARPASASIIHQSTETLIELSEELQGPPVVNHTLTEAIIVGVNAVSLLREGLGGGTTFISQVVPIVH